MVLVVPAVCLVDSFTFGCIACPVVQQSIPAVSLPSLFSRCRLKLHEALGTVHHRQNRAPTFRLFHAHAPIPFAARLHPSCNQFRVVVLVVLFPLRPTPRFLVLFYRLSVGESYYTVRAVSVPGSIEPAWKEKQTVRERLFVSAPGIDSIGSTSSQVQCPWYVKPTVSASLADVLRGPLFSLEKRLYRASRPSSPGGVSGGAEIESPALVAATAACLRSCASTCVRAALLCAPGTEATGGGGGVGADTDIGSDGDGTGGPNGIWSDIGPKVTMLRNRWASASVKSRSSLLTAGGGGPHGGGDKDSARTVCLSSEVLSGFLAGTPLMLSDEAAMELLPGSLQSALVGCAAGTDRGSGSNSRGSLWPPYGWRRAQALSSLLWMRDAAEASCKIHLCPSEASIEGKLFVDTLKSTEAAVIALVDACRENGWGQDALDLALARTCAGMFAAEVARVRHGKGVSLSLETKKAVISWAISKFLLSGGRIAAMTHTPSSNSAAGAWRKEDDFALCLEVSRLLTTVAWDGRKGWGSDGSSSVSMAPSRMLVAGPQEASEIWAAAREPRVWRGLHAALVGAVGSPIQTNAFEVLEAAAAAWDCGEEASSSEEEAKGGVGGVRTGEGGREVQIREEREESTDGEAVEPSIVSRLARVLDGWGLASLQRGQKITGDVGAGSGGEDIAASVAVREDKLPSADAAQEEAQEQQDDLELIARYGKR